MTVYETGFCDGSSGQCNVYSSSPSSRHTGRHKPIEIYAFIDPMCPICWAMEPLVKKLVIEYGQYFKMRYVIGGKLSSFNERKQSKKNAKDLMERWERISIRYGMPCNGDIWHEHPTISTYNTAIAVKAAELQGKRAGLRFLRKIREAFFLNKENISRENVLLHCAEQTNLDLQEFQRDMHANGAVKAFQCDMKTTSEMEIDQFPSLVFLNANAEEGVKINGYYPYEAYEHVICEMLGAEATSSEPPPVDGFLKKYPFVATKEIAVVYNWSASEVEREMKKRVLQQTVERIPVKHGTFWRYIGDETIKAR